MPDYASWLVDPIAERCVLLEMQAYRPGVGVITHYASNRGYCSHPMDYPPNTEYPALISSVPEISIEIGRSTQIGDIEFVNPSGVIDAWVTDDFALRQITLLIGDPAWGRDDFIAFQLLAGCDGLKSTSAGKLVLTVSDRTAALSRPIHTATSDDGKLRPLVFGMVFNITPLFISESGGAATYQASDSVLAAISPRSGGLEIDPARLTFDLNVGTFTVDPAPNGDVTCDAKTTETKILALAEALITQAGVEVDADNFDFWKSTCPQTGGLFLDEKTTYADALAELLGSLGLNWTDWPDGKIRLFRVAAPSGNPVAIFTAGHIQLRNLSPDGVIPPLASLRLGYRRNYTTQSNLFEGVSASEKDVFSREWSAVVGENLGVITNYLGASEMPDDLIPTALNEKADAEAENVRRLAVYPSPIQKFRATVSGLPLFRPGDAILLEYDRYGFDSGAYGMASAIYWNPTKYYMSVGFWRWQ